MLKRFWAGIYQALKTNLLFLLVSGGIFYWLYLRHLDNLTAGFSQTEKSYMIANSSLTAVWHNPLYAPHKLLQLLTHKMIGGPMGWRLASVIFALLILLNFYWLCSRWFGRWISWTATILLAATPLMVLAARQANGTIVFAWPVVVINVYYWLFQARRYLNRAWLLMCLIAGISFYIPGMAWLMLGGLVVARHNLRIIASKLNSWSLWLGPIIFVLTVAPLAYRLSQQPSMIRSLLFIPTVWPTLLTVIKSVAWSLIAIFVRAPYHFDLIVGRLSALSLPITALFCFGGYAMWSMARKKFMIMIGMILFAVIASGLNHDLGLLLAAFPAAVIVAAAGLRFLLLEWQAVFPKNPLPKYFAKLLILSLLVLQIGYASTYCLSAWPHSSATRAVYVLK